MTHSNINLDAQICAIYVRNCCFKVRSIKKIDKSQQLLLKIKVPLSTLPSQVRLG